METLRTSPGRSTPAVEVLKREVKENPQGEGRSSPPPNCAICLGACQNKSFTDSCLHQFCFNCLLTWSKIKAECPLCKQTFKSIIHNVRSNHQYEEYQVVQEAIPLTIEDTPEQSRRFRYRTTITFPRSEGSAIESLLVRHADVVVPSRRDNYAHRRPFRQAVYRHNLWARFLPDFTGRLRECTPEFFRANEAQRYRLVPWLTRELDFLLENNHSHIAYVMAQIIDLLPVCSITSPEFNRAMLPFFEERTEHFLHELLVFASTPYDMLGYDRNVQYDPDPRLGANVNHVISSSESDSDVVVVDRITNHAARLPPQNIIPMEASQHSDTDDSSAEVIMTGYIKPPQDRTPEVVDLLASDSDVLVMEQTPSTSREIPSASALVKLTLSRRVRPPDSSDEEYVPRIRRKRRYRSQNSASTTSTRRDTPSPSDASWNPDTSAASSCSREPSPSYTPPLADLPHAKKEPKDKRKKLKKRRERSRSPKPRERDRRKSKKAKKSKRTRPEKSRRTSDHDRPGTSRETERENKLICTLPISSFHSRFRSASDRNASENQPGCSRDVDRNSDESRWRAGARPSRAGPRVMRMLSSSDSEDDIPLNLTVKK